jgi:hypothetical protein
MPATYPPKKRRDWRDFISAIFITIAYAPLEFYVWGKKKINDKVYAVAIDRARCTQPNLGWNGNRYYMTAGAKFLWKYAEYTRGTVELKRLGHSDAYIVCDTNGAIYRDTAGDIIFDFDAARALAIQALDDNARLEMPGFGSANAFGTSWKYQYHANSSSAGLLDYRLMMHHPNKRNAPVSYVSVDTKPGLARIQSGPWTNHNTMARAELVTLPIDCLIYDLRAATRSTEQALGTSVVEQQLLS